MLSQFPALHENWREELGQHPRSIIFCWAAWSQYDFMFSPVLARVMPDLEECAFFTADLDEQVLWPLFVESHVMTIPCLLLWKNGMVVERSVGYMGDESLRERLKTWGCSENDLNIYRRIQTKAPRTNLVRGALVLSDRSYRPLVDMKLMRSATRFE